MADYKLADMLQGRNPQFQEENYVPSEVDYWRMMQRQALDSAISSGITGLGGLGLSGMAFADSTRGGLGSRMAHKLFGTAAGGLGVGGMAAMYDDINRRSTAGRRAAEWEQGGRAWTPEEMEQMFRPRPPISK